ncbi:Lrp/AsnC family transcriptional regulator [Fulvivirgaceae bacterium PWU4]|uniref:Lrp/AsnC family transcriptional regulator n=1 Tax=Chryseosolibacter histidini TaxID=2782349 RepID=A0AAP2GHV1_9BACT|nr:Lrp/AsnC family transcriptional regulator [Chryseosolibacter histidini]MBT1696441.1 Lrp/AsnC family transcriptional regulator [Chryseosolibacter histidini]
MDRRSKAMDDLDWRILEELQQNARISASEIGRRVGLTAPAVAERISRMEEEGLIQGYRTVIDYDKIGLTVRVFINFKSTALKHAEVVKLISTMPEITEWYTVTGDCCMLLKVAVATTKELELFLEKLGKYGETATSIILSGNPEPRVVVRSKK